MRRLSAGLFSVFLSTLTLAAFSQADIILVNGKVFTSNQNHLFAQAVAVKANKILAVGNDADIKNLATAKTKVIDLQGKTVVPGFNDAHYHHEPYLAGYSIFYPQDGSEPSWQQLTDSIQAAVKSLPAGTFIYATMGNVIGTDTTITRRQLDALSPDHPLLISAYWGHVGYFNTAMMKALHIEESEKDPQGGYFERYAGTRILNGRAHEYANVILHYRQPRTAALFDASLQDLGQQALHLGITSIQNMCTGGRPEEYISAFRKTELPIRFRLIRWGMVNSDGSLDVPSKQIQGAVKGLPLVMVSGTKWVLDGTPIERDAWMNMNYQDMPTRGRLNFSKAQVQAMLSDVQSRKDQPIFHVVGDASINYLLDELSKQPASWKGRRVRFEHGDGLMPARYEQAKGLGIIVIQNSTHFTLVDLLPKRFDPVTLSGEQPLKSLINAGIPVALGSDGPLSPYVNIMFASMHPLRPQEAITREQAVIAYTKTAAYAEGADNKGMLAPGQLADLAVLSQDIFTIPLQQLPATRSLLTMVDGKIRYRAE